MKHVIHALIVHFSRKTISYLTFKAQANSQRTRTTPGQKPIKETTALSQSFPTESKRQPGNQKQVHVSQIDFDGTIVHVRCDPDLPVCIKGSIGFNPKQ
jgi:hypothetical protein